MASSAPSSSTQPHRGAAAAAAAAAAPPTSIVTDMIERFRALFGESTTSGPATRGTLGTRVTTLEPSVPQAAAAAAAAPTSTTSSLLLESRRYLPPYERVIVPDPTLRAIIEAASKWRPPAPTAKDLRAEAKKDTSSSSKAASGGAGGLLASDSSSSDLDDWVGVATSSAKPLTLFREKKPGEADEAYARAKDAFEKANVKKPTSAAPLFGSGSLILNRASLLPSYFTASKETLHYYVKGLLVYLAHVGKVADVYDPSSIEAAKEVFPDLDFTATHVMPAVEGMLARGMCFGFASAFATYLTQVNEKLPSEKEYVEAFTAKGFDTLAPYIQFLYIVRAKGICDVLPLEDKARYEEKQQQVLKQEQEKEHTIFRKLDFSPLPRTEFDYEGYLLTLLQEQIQNTFHVNVYIQFVSNYLDRVEDKLPDSFLKKQVLSLFSSYNDKPVVISFEGHSLCLYKSEDCHLLYDSNRGCKLYASQEEAVKGVAGHIRSYGKDCILDYHVFESRS